MLPRRPFCTNWLYVCEILWRVDCGRRMQSYPCVCLHVSLLSSRRKVSQKRPHSPHFRYIVCFFGHNWSENRSRLRGARIVDAYCSTLTTLPSRGRSCRYALNAKATRKNGFYVLQRYPRFCHDHLLCEHGWKLPIHRWIGPSDLVFDHHHISLDGGYINGQIPGVQKRRGQQALTTCFPSKRLAICYRPRHPRQPLLGHAVLWLRNSVRILRVQIRKLHVRWVIKEEDG